MEFIPFFHKCPETSKTETRETILTEDNQYGLPPGEYAYMESYCGDAKCDCRKVMINVVRVDRNNDNNSRIIATIGFGWEDVGYYTKWLYGDSETAKEMKEANLEVGAQQSKYSDACLDLVKNACVNDEKFMERVKKHYKEFKKVIKDEQKIIKTNTIGRNESCPCGSGKKYKKCCLG